MQEYFSAGEGFQEHPEGPLAERQLDVEVEVAEIHADGEPGTESSEPMPDLANQVRAEVAEEPFGDDRQPARGVEPRGRRLHRRVAGDVERHDVVARAVQAGARQRLALAPRHLWKIGLEVVQAGEAA